MNEPIDHKHEDKQISALYQKASAEQPPEHLDNAILAAAKREVRAKPRAVSPFSTRWTLPFSLAAVVVLSVSVVTLVQKEPSMEATGSADRLGQAAESALAHQEEKIAKLKTQAAAPQAESEISAVVSSKKPVTSSKKLQSPERLAEPPPLLPSPQRETEIRVPSSGLSAELTSKETLADSTPQPSEAVPLAETPKRLKLSRTTVPQEPKAEERKADIAESSDNEISTASAAIQPLDESQQQPSRGVLAFRLGSSEPACVLLAPKMCLQSPKCTYILSNESDEQDERYLCREAANHCEQGFDQLQGSKQSCESKPGCLFVPGHCNCLEAQPCDCQGKNPTQCVQQ